MRFKRPTWIPPGDHFIVVTERDTFTLPTYAWDALGIPYLVCGHEPCGPITWEGYMQGRDEAERRAAGLGRYGRRAVAKLVFMWADQ